MEEIHRFIRQRCHISPYLVGLDLSPTCLSPTLPSKTDTVTWVLLRDFPDHATFREKGAKLACADKLGVFLSLTLCNKANFDPLQRVKYDDLGKI